MLPFEHSSSVCVNPNSVQLGASVQDASTTLVSKKKNIEVTINIISFFMLIPLNLKLNNRANLMRIKFII